jgi:hypothetical protein
MTLLIRKRIANLIKKSRTLKRIILLLMAYNSCRVKRAGRHRQFGSLFFQLRFSQLSLGLGVLLTVNRLFRTIQCFQ